jgi:aspartyl-tRNA(Asn)/glutamyl-tRNA(Gln) amidotransferase subunit A
LAVTKIHLLSAAQLAARYLDRSLSPAEVLEDTLSRSKLVQDKLNAFLMFDAEQARVAAEQSARRWREGKPLSELDGVPLAIKDTDSFVGHRKTVGSLANKDLAPATTDSLHIGSLRAAGVVVFGRTNMPDRGWKGIGDGPLAGVVRNPWDPVVTPGGSSAGSAVAVATGCAPIATGTDGVNCGCLKPRIIPRHGVRSFRASRLE